MPLGPGKYDDLCTYVREQTKAQGVMVIVVDGNRGHGFSCHGSIPVLLFLEQFLRDTADQIRDSMKGTEQA